MHFRQHRRNVVDTVKGFLLEPTKSFNRERKTKLPDAATYFLSLLLLESVLASFVWMLMSQFRLSPIFWLVGTFAFYIFMVALKVVWAAWLHVWVSLLSKGSDLQQTMKTVFFAKTPFYVFGWLPFINILALVWELVLTAIGLSRMHKINQGTATTIVVVAVVIPLILVTLFALTVVALVFSAFPMFGGSQMMWMR